MNIVLQLATGANVLGAAIEAVEEKGFGLNFDVLETNLINLLIVIGLLVYFLKGPLTNTLSDRSAAIDKALSEAELKKAATEKALIVEQGKLKTAQAEAAQIVQKAQADAVRAKEAILAKGKADVAAMQAAAVADMGADQAKVMAQLRQRVAELAMAKAGETLPGRLDSGKQQKLIDRSISLLGGR
jgi:F-type H+-transporting ATPase subunit b